MLVTSSGGSATVPAAEPSKLPSIAIWFRKPVISGLLLAVPIVIQFILVTRRLLDWWPVWAWYPDPGYQYLFASGSIITGGTTDLIYHPGTSFQWLIGLSLFLTHVLAGEGSFMLDVAARPEFYSQSTGVVLAAIYIAALSLAAWRMFRWFGLVPALVFQLLLLWGLPLLSAGRYVLWPESLVLTVAVATLALIAPQLSGQESKNPQHQAVWLGLASAVGLTAKVTFTPFVLLVLMLLAKRQLLWFFAPFIAAAALAATALMRLGRSIQSAWSRAVGVVALAVSLFLAAHGVVQEEYFSQALEPRIDDIVRTAEEINERNVEGVWATGYNAWTPDSSRVFGLIWSAGRFNDEIRQVSPDAKHFDLFGRRILQVNVDGELASLSCQELQDLAARSRVGVIVESQGHIARDPSSERILLSNATADPVQPSQLGRYFAFPLTGIRCT